MRFCAFVLSILSFIIIFFKTEVCAQITAVTVETFYTDDGTITGYPADHTTYRIYAYVTNPTDRVAGISGVQGAPLNLNITGNGVWNTIMGGVTGDDLNCAITQAFPIAAYDSFVTIGLSCDSDGSSFTTYAAEDPAATWMQQMFNNTDYGTIQVVNVNTQVGAGWFTMPTNPATLPDANNKILLAQITTNGTVCGVFNAQVFPEYTGPGSPYIIQNGLEFGDIFDSDGDGFSACDGDCADNNPSVNPGSAELCNGIDDNCDGQIDEGLSQAYFRDFDGDGFGDPLDTEVACSQPTGYVSNALDCDDVNPNINSGATEVCNDQDDNCDGDIDEGIVYSTYYVDSDGDGFGNIDQPLVLCEMIAGVADNSLDCDDNDAVVNPNGTEICNYIDDNCDGTADEGLILNTYYLDEDGDGFGNPNESVQACEALGNYIDDNSDCNDSDPGVNPGEVEICNGADDNCDGAADEGIATFTYYFDNDLDGYGDLNNAVDDCVMPIGYAEIPGDCDDSDSNINPATVEICNGIDDNCDGNIDEGFEILTYYLDNDQDGYGDLNNAVTDCSMPIGYVEIPGDCDDSDSNINPATVEICNGIDDNCDGNIDEGLEILTYYFDNDQDGYGDLNNAVTDCVMPIGYVEIPGDCDDSDSNINPATVEICNGIDDNCDTSIDENLALSVYYLDADNDGFGNVQIFVESCSPVAGYVLNDTDCDDGNSSVSPNAPEQCNEEDDNCNGLIDENIVDIEFFADADGDGFGSVSLGLLCIAPPNSSTTAGDCNDEDANVNPNVAEVCNELDDNCDGNIDEFVGITFYEDQDGDGYGNTNVTVISCEQHEGYSALNGDCDDNNAAINPGATELCNNVDDDCDSSADEELTVLTYFADSDMDGFGDGNNAVDSCIPPAYYVLNNEDCDDTNGAIFPGSNENCNDIDDDCDGEIDEDVVFEEYYTDSDGDGFGTDLLGLFCQTPENASLLSGDCNDNDISVNPSATELCNSIDDNCNGGIDEDLVLVTYYSDADGDGVGAENLGEFCQAPANSSTVSGDCDDTNAAINPEATEICNQIDDNCNEAIDEFLGTVYFADNDNDGYGNAGQSQVACEQPVGYSINGNDCDDSDADINPDASEIPGNDIDEDCDGEIIIGLREMITSRIVMYPNPVIDELFIAATGLQGATQIIIFDALGKTIAQYMVNVGDQPIRVNCQQLAQGNYHISLESSSHKISGRFIKL